jgi:two-component system, NtrC family, sensor kinase
MSLKRKFLLRNWGLVLGVLVVSAAALWCLLDLRPVLATVRQAYQDVGVIQSASNQVNVARKALSGDTPNIAFAREQFSRAAGNLNTFIENEKKNYYMDSAQAALKLVTGAIASLDGRPADTKAAYESTEDVNRHVTAAIFYCQAFIQRKDLLAVAKLRDGLLIIGGVIALTLVAAGVLGYVQYREVMVPLNRLREGVQRVASAQFSERLEEKGEKEFAELAAEFNRMAADLDSFYKTLEEKVEAKSRELVRSERLASVGFLAAGVSHEINNPLNIISGYAELAAKRITSSTDANAIKDAIHALRVIRDEAFRCKEITSKLLSLAKGDTAGRQDLALESVVRDVAVLAGGLKDYRDRMIELKLDGPLTVKANATEMTQVLLNLTVNALEAVKPGEGKVLIEGHRRNGWVELSVCDNGYGITAEALKKVFEPFYTRRVGNRAPGTGLGLSITHAIVESHGGRIRAESKGAGQGSRFTVELPSAVKGES